MKEEDLEFHAWPPRPVGGQHVGTPAGVLVRHKPTGICVTVDLGRSQYHHPSVTQVSSWEELLITLGLALGGPEL